MHKIFVVRLKNFLCYVSLPFEIENVEAIDAGREGSHTTLA